VHPRSGKIALLQMDGEISREELLKAIEAGKKGIMEIYELQKKALKEKYRKERGKSASFSWQTARKWWWRYTTSTTR